MSDNKNNENTHDKNEGVDDVEAQSDGFVAVAVEGGNLEGQVPHPPRGSPLQSQQINQSVFHHPSHLNRSNSVRRFKMVSDASSVFGGFGELHDTVKLHRKIVESSKGGNYETLERMYEDSPSSHDNGAMKMDENELRFRCRESAGRQAFALIFGFFLSFMAVGITVFVHVADMAIPNAMLYAMYTVTSTGFGMMQIPHTPGFFFFATVFMFVGVGSLTLVAFETYLYIALEFSRIKRRLDHGRTTADPISTPAPGVGKGKARLAMIADSAMSCAAFLAATVRKSNWGRFAVFGGYLCFLLLSGSIVMMILEDWSFIRALYYGTYVMTTVGYGDVTPVTLPGIWFSIFWLPFNVTFVSIYMGNLAHYFMMACDAMARRLYNQEMKALNATNDGHLEPLAASVPDGDDGQPGAGLLTMKDVVEVVLESFYHVSESTDDVDHKNDHHEAENCLLQFLKLESPWTTSGCYHSNKVRKPSFSLQVLMQERLATILAEEIAGKCSDFVEKDLTYAFTIDDLQETVKKWKIPAGAQEAFCVAAFEVIAFLGEKRLVVDRTDAILNLTPTDCHDLLSAVLAAYEDAGTMEGWLASTEELASGYASVSTFSVDFDAQNAKVSQDVSQSGSTHHLFNKFRECCSDEKIAELSKLRAKYNHSLDNIQVSNHAQYQSNRMILFGVVSFFLVYEVLITTFIIIHADLKVNLGILFTLYTVTSAGFGNVVIPKTDAFLGFAVLNVFISISLLAIVIAQSFMYWSYVAVRSNHSRDKLIMAGNGRAILTNLLRNHGNPKTTRDAMRAELFKSLQLMPVTEGCECSSSRSKLYNFLLKTPLGRKVLVGGTMIMLMAIGIVAMMTIEGWTFMKSLYFATYALLTVGHGDVTPQTDAGLWFLDAWLPFNVLFVALYLGSVAHIYVQWRQKFVNRVESRMRDALLADIRLAASNADSETKEKQPVTSMRRRRIELNSKGRLFGYRGMEIVTARDLLRQLDETWSECGSRSSSSANKSNENGTDDKSNSDTLDTPAKYQSMLRSTHKSTHDQFILRLTVMDRLARVVSCQLKDFHAGLEIDGNTVLVTVESLKDWASEWKVPHGARSVYREITFEALLLVGEKDVIHRGLGAFLDLNVTEFIELFSPFVFALRDTEAMMGWLASTENLAVNRLPTALEESNSDDVPTQPQQENRRVLRNTVPNFFPLNPGNAGRSQLM